MNKLELAYSLLIHEYMPRSPGYRPKPWEKIAGYSAAGLILVTIIYLIIRNKDFADPNLVVLSRVLTSLCVAVFGAVIPGFLNVDWSFKGASIRAGGALALFVITFFATPKVISSSSVLHRERMEEALAFVAGYGLELSRNETNRRINLGADESRYALRELMILSESNPLDSTAVNGLAREILDKYGPVRKTQFLNAIEITERCLSFQDGSIPMAIGLELEDLLKPFNLPPSLDRVPTSDSWVWLQDIGEHYLRTIHEGKRPLAGQGQANGVR